MMQPRERSFATIGEKIKILEYIKLADKETRKRWKIRTVGIRHGTGEHDKKTGEEKQIGPTDETIRNWLAGGAVDPRKVAELCEVLNIYFILPHTLTVRDFSDDVDEAEFMKLVGYDEINMHITESALWAEKNLPGSRFALEPSDKPDVIEQALQGLYLGYRTVRVGNGSARKAEIRMALTYVSPISTRRGEKRLFMPCLLTIRSRDRRVLYKYKGAFSRKPTMTFIFHQENSPDPDMVTMMTDKGDPDQKSTTNGYMLTASEGPKYQPMVCDVRLRWLGRFRSLTEMNEFLNGSQIEGEGTPGNQRLTTTAPAKGRGVGLDIQSHRIR